MIFIKSLLVIEIVVITFLVTNVDFSIFLDMNFIFGKVAVLFKTSCLMTSKTSEKNYFRLMRTYKNRTDAPFELILRI